LKRPTFKRPQFRRPQFKRPTFTRPPLASVRAAAATGIATLLVLLALLLPDRLGRLYLVFFFRLPIEAVLLTAVFLVLPARATRARKVLAAAVGLGLGLLTIVKLLDMGFQEVLVRPFDPLLDFPLAVNAFDFVKDANGKTTAIGGAIGIVVLIVVLLVLMTWAVFRLSRIVVRHRATAGTAVTGLGVLWVVLAVLGANIVPYAPLASRNSASIAYRHLAQIPEDIADSREFAAEQRVDAFEKTPSDQLLTGLRGKDVVFAFVESYGRTALESPEMAPAIGKVLADGGSQLKAAGYASRSGWLTSPTAGGGSWLAQSTLMSGLWIKNQKRYDKFVASDRTTLNGYFKRADFHTLAMVPGVKKDWPEARVFDFDTIYAAHSLGYQGPKFAWSWMPDQYVLSQFEESEHGPEHGPLMAEIPLTSSHVPWTPLPSLIDWDHVGDGSVFGPMAKPTGPSDPFNRNGPLVRARYSKAVQYTLSTLISYVQKYGDDKMVLVFLGDHQAFPLVAGQNASHDVPITILAKDPAVLDRVADWGWTDGLRPAAKAPVWPMSAFRDKFLTAFGPQGAR
jgi:hypothetical protein